MALAIAGAMRGQAGSERGEPSGDLPGRPGRGFSAREGERPLPAQEINTPPQQCGDGKLRKQSGGSLN